MRRNSCRKDFKVCTRREFKDRKLLAELLNKNYVLAAVRCRSFWTKKRPWPEHGPKSRRTAVVLKRKRIVGIIEGSVFRCVIYKLKQKVLVLHAKGEGTRFWCYIYYEMPFFLHWPYKEHLTLKKVTTRYQQQIFQPTRKAIRNM